MSFTLARTDRLLLERDGRLLLRPDPGDENLLLEDLGLIDGAHQVPDDLAGELAELRRAWDDSDDEAGLHAEWAADFRAAARPRP